jgi:hypothetical protein
MTPQQNSLIKLDVRAAGYFWNRKQKDRPTVSQITVCGTTTA